MEPNVHGFSGGVKKSEYNGRGPQNNVSPLNYGWIQCLEKNHNFLKSFKIVLSFGQGRTFLAQDEFISRCRKNY